MENIDEIETWRNVHNWRNRGLPLTTLQVQGTQVFLFIKMLQGIHLELGINRHKLVAQFRRECRFLSRPLLTLTKNRWSPTFQNVYSHLKFSNN